MSAGRTAWQRSDRGMRRCIDGCACVWVTGQACAYPIRVWRGRGMRGEGVDVRPEEGESGGKRDLERWSNMGA
eukprot:scaffold1762_cov39-Tisochrysis_lutea.AAC.1